MALSIPVRSRLEGNRKTIVTRRVAIRGTTLTSRKRRSHLSRGRRHIRRRRSIRNMRTTRIVERKRRQRRGEWRIGRERRTRWGGRWRWEDVASARTGREGGSIGTEGGVSENNRKEMSSTEKAEEEGHG
jgi:hypothetical protein